MSVALRTRVVARQLRPALIVIGLAVVIAMLVNDKVQGVAGQTSALLLLAALVGGSFLVVFAYVGPMPVTVWPVATTVGYLAQFPRTHPVVTFDRMWIGGMIAFIALTPRPLPRSRYTRPLMFGLLWLTLAFGARAFATEASIGGPAATWIDAILLPTLLFVASERYCLGSSDRRRRLLRSVMVGGGVLACIGIAERLFGFQLATVTGGSIRFDAGIDQTRISGPYPAPEPYALSLLMCFAATVYWFISYRGRYRPWVVLIALLEVSAIGLTLFRASWIGALLIVIAAVGIRPGRFGRLFAVVALVGAIGLAAASALEQNKTFSKRTNDTTNIYGRFATYEQGLQIFKSAPVFGIGVNQYHTVSEQRPPTVVKGIAAVSYPHSSLIGLLAEQGIFGVAPLLFLCFAVSRLLRGVRAARAFDPEAVIIAAVLAGAVAAYVIMSLTLTMLPYEPSNAFFVVLLAAASSYVDRRVEGAPT